MANEYRSRIDPWLLAVLGGAAAISLAAAVLVVSRSPTIAGALIAVFTAAIGAGLPLWLLESTHYTVVHDRLLVRSGPFSWRIPLADITAVTPSTNPLSSPALSLNRLRIDYGPGRSVMISPRDRARFLAELDAGRNAAAR
ncbi:PH domain-containing protein [Luteimonas cellulosilyticus]|nr:PH domain-containing protein [Luteimonas cellulosilyticus]